MPRLIANIKFEDAVDSEIDLFQSLLSQRSFTCLGSRHSDDLAIEHCSHLVTMEKKGSIQQVIREVKDAGSKVGRLFSLTVMQSRR